MALLASRTPEGALQDPLTFASRQIAAQELVGADLVRLSEEQALQRSFDARNRRVLPWLLWPFGFYFLMATIRSFGERGGAGWPLAVPGLLLCAGSVVALRRLLPGGKRAGAPLRPAGEALGRRFGDLLPFELVAIVLLAAAWGLGTAENFPFLHVSAPILMGFRLRLGAILGAHAVVVAAVGVLLWASSVESKLEIIISAAAMHAICAVGGWLLSRRFRHRFLGDWRQAVVHVRERRRLHEDLALARAVQLSMLPEATPELPWLDVAAFCLPAAEVGGDYYDFFPEEGALAVTVADVAGHGIASGLVLATVRSGLALLMEEPGDGERTLRRLDRLVRRSSRRMLVTLALARFDVARREVSVTAAGHPPILVRRARGGSVEELGSPAPPLGTRLPPSWRSAITPFGAGDAFLLYSDGLFEAQNGAGEPYGMERLHRLLAAWEGRDGAAGLCAAVIADLERHRAAAPQEDDLTVVALVAR